MCSQLVNNSGEMCGQLVSNRANSLRCKGFGGGCQHGWRRGEWVSEAETYAPRPSTWPGAFVPAGVHARDKTYAWWVAPGEWPSGGFQVAHGEARRVLALAQSVAVDGAAGAAQEACSGAHAVAHDGAPPIGAGDGDGPFQGGWGRRLGAVGPVSPGVHEP